MMLKIDQLNLMLFLMTMTIFRSQKMNEVNEQDKRQNEVLAESDEQIYQIEKIL